MVLAVAQLVVQQLLLLCRSHALVLWCQAQALTAPAAAGHATRAAAAAAAAAKRLALLQAKWHSNLALLVTNVLQRAAIVLRSRQSSSIPSSNPSSNSNSSSNR
jgi:hypothetical protein